jgi:hypothetical protein
MSAKKAQAAINALIRDIETLPAKGLTEKHDGGLAYGLAVFEASQRAIRKLPGDNRKLLREMDADLKKIVDSWGAK